MTSQGYGRNLPNGLLSRNLVIEEWKVGEKLDLLNVKLLHRVMGRYEHLSEQRRRKEALSQKEELLILTQSVLFSFPVFLIFYGISQMK